MKPLKYIDASGHELFVSCGGIGAKKSYGTFYRKKTGSLKRVCAAALPMVDDFRQAQADLDKYAKSKKLKQTQDGSIHE